MEPGPLLLTLSVCLCLEGGAPESILMVTLAPTSSHKVPFLAVGEALAARGHEVTLVSGFPGEGVSGVREVCPLDLQQTLQDVWDLDVVADVLRGYRYSLASRVVARGVINYFYQSCKVFFLAPETEQLLQKSWHLLVLDTYPPDCLQALAHTLKVPFIYINALPAFVNPLSLAGSPAMISVTPFAEGETTDRMGFWERTVNAMQHIGVLGFCHFCRLLYIEPLLREMLGGDLPSLSSISSNVSLILQNGHHSVTYPRPYLPGVVEVGCLQCREARPLSQDLEEFVSGGRRNGFIFVSFGSLQHINNQTDELRSKMLKAFRQLEYQVVWRWGGDVMADLPDNVRLEPWLPQQDLLGHAKIKAFVNHGGVHGVLEAVYHGTPMVCIPMWFDNIGLSHKAQQDGYAVTVTLSSLTANTLLAAVTSVVRDHRFQESARRRSALLRDQPLPPLEAAVYWVQYVMRHEGAYHLQGAAKDLGFLQYFMLDLLAALVLAAYVTSYSLRTLCRYIFRRRKHKKLKLK